MSSKLDNVIDASRQEQIAEILDKGNRVEIVPVKDGVKVLEIKKTVVK